MPNLPNVSTYMYPATDQFMQAVAQAASHAALAAVEATASKAPPQPGSHSQPPTVHLPKRKLPTFSGDILSWPDFCKFWDMFTASVDAQKFPNFSKFTYLKSAVKGPASRLIVGLAVTDQNYPLALQMLQTEFGKPDIIIAKLYSRLQDLPVSGTRQRETKVAYETIENLQLQLEAQGENLRGQRLVSQHILVTAPCRKL